MNRRLIFALSAALAATLGATDSAQAQFYGAWHGSYYHSAWGQPVAMVVPPTVRWQSHYQWGVPSTRVTPVFHQFHRGFLAPVEHPVFMPTPRWPSSTDQLGVYPVRGPSPW